LKTKCCWFSWIAARCSVLRKKTPLCLLMWHAHWIFLWCLYHALKLWSGWLWACDTLLECYFHRDWSAMHTNILVVYWSNLSGLLASLVILVYSCFLIDVHPYHLVRQISLVYFDGCLVGSINFVRVKGWHIIFTF